KEIIKINRAYGDASEERLKKYEYKENGYRTLEYRTKIIHDTRTAPRSLQGDLLSPDSIFDKFLVEDNQLLSIEEFQLDPEKRIVEQKHTDLLKNEVKLKKFDFEGELLKKESHFDLVGEFQTLKYKIIFNYDENGRIISKMEFDYSSGESEVV